MAPASLRELGRTLQLWRGTSCGDSVMVTWISISFSSSPTSPLYFRARRRPGSVPFHIWISVLSTPRCGMGGQPWTRSKVSLSLFTKPRILRNKARRRFHPCAEPLEAILRGCVSSCVSLNGSLNGAAGVCCGQSGKS